MKLSKRTIKEFKEYLRLPYEVCGALHNDGTPHKYVIKGPKIAHTLRGSCTMPRHHHVWHTHPKQSKPVPSIEDIMRVMHKINRKTSVIVTTLGIYTLTNVNYKKQKYYVKEKLEPAIYSHIQTFVSASINALLKYFRRRSSVQYSNNVKRLQIKQTITHLNKYLKNFLKIEYLPFES